MREYSFKAFVSGTEEQYVSWKKTERGEVTVLTPIAFPNTLISLAYMDIEPLAERIQQLIDALQLLARTQGEQQKEKIDDLLLRFPSYSAYFLQLSADFRDRVYHALQFNHYEEDLLQIEYLRGIPDTLKRMQVQIIDLFANVLDMDSKDHRSVSEKLIAYYKRTDADAFQFCPQLTNFELISAEGEEFFADVLKPTSVYDIIDFHLRECIKREVKVRRCKNCGRYFAVTGRSTTEYCNRPYDNKGRTCKEVGAIAQWARSKKDDDVFNDYRREYKKRFARMKAGKLDGDEFYAWSKAAREVKAACEAGEITPDKFRAWLDIT